MADQLTSSEEIYHDNMTQAVDQIKRTPELRFFMRQLLALAGTTAQINPEATNTALYQFGRQSMGTDIAGVLMSYEPTLYADLLREDALQTITENFDEE